jgi:hypothetical protein
MFKKYINLIANNYDEEDGIAVSGAYNDYETSSDVYSNLTVIPPPGWIIRFKPKSVGLFEPDYPISEVSIFPNPASAYINIPSHVFI